jgi:hypothetical protein
MPPNFQFEFSYPSLPRITLRLTARETGRSGRTGALLDTGAEISLFDLTVAERIGLDLVHAPTVVISGVGGELSGARLATVELMLLDEADLSIALPVAFTPLEGLGVGNLLGLDVLSHFDFGLSHRDRLGYLGHPG